jgi:hypothetical protein
MFLSALVCSNQVCKNAHRLQHNTHDRHTHTHIYRHIYAKHTDTHIHTRTNTHNAHTHTHTQGTELAAPVPCAGEPGEPPPSVVIR